MNLDMMYVKALARSASAEDLERFLSGYGDRLLESGEARDIYSQISGYYRETKQVIPWDLVKGKLERPDLPDGVDVRFVTARLRARRAFQEMKGPFAEAIRLREQGKVVEAAAPLKAAAEIAASAGRLGSAESLLALGPEVKKLYIQSREGHIGIPFPWRTLNDLTTGMREKTLTYFVGRPFAGKCVSESTQVVDVDTGEVLSVMEAVGKKVRIPSWKKGYGINPYLPEAHLDMGVKECIRVSFKSGSWIEVTPEHPFLGIDGERKAQDIQVGERLAVATKIPLPLKPVEIGDEVVIVVAALLAEGNLTHGNIGFTNDDQDIVAEVREMVERFGCRLVNPPSAKRYEYHIIGTRKGHKNNAVREMLRFLEMLGKKSPQKEIPGIMFGLGERQLGLFLGMLWSCDGSIERKGDQTYCSSSEKMARQVRHLLLRLGVFSTVREKTARCNGKAHKAWELRVLSMFGDEFRKKVRLVGEKERKIQQKRYSTKGVLLPMSDVLVGRIEEIIRTSDKRLKDVAEVLGWKIAGKREWHGINRKFYNRTSRAVFEKRKLITKHGIALRNFMVFCDVYGCREEFEWLWKDIVWDDVASVESVGPKRVFDFTVEDGHYFVANDVVVHNTFVCIMIARHAWVEGKRVLFFSPEMSAVEIAERTFAIMSRSSYYLVVRGALGEFGEKRFFEIMDQMQGQEGFYVDEQSRTPDEIEASIMDVKPDLIVFDAAYSLRIGRGNRLERAPAVVEYLVDLVKRCKIPGVASTQFGRAADKEKKYTLGTIGFTDAISQDAHNVFGLVQTDEMKADKVLDIIPLKVRRSAMMMGKEKVQIRWDTELCLFDEINEETYKDEGFEKDKPGDEFSDLPF